MTTRKQYLQDTAGQLHIKIDSSYDRPVQPQDRPNPSISRHEVPSLAKELLLVEGSYWEKEWKFSLRVQHLLNWKRPVDSNTPKNIQATQTRLDGLGKKRRHKLEQVEKVGFFREELGDKNMQPNISYRTLKELKEIRENAYHWSLSILLCCPS